MDLMVAGLSSTRIPLYCAPKSEHLALFLGVNGEKKDSGATSFHPGETKPRDLGQTGTSHSRSLQRWPGSVGCSPPREPGHRGVVFIFSLAHASVRLRGGHQHIFAAEQIASLTANALPWVGRKYFLVKAAAFLLFLLGH